MLQEEDVSPNPEFLIKSIAEQGYSLETSLADLIDNSISAKASNVEILVETEQEPFTLFLADDGCGMTDAELAANLKFPSGSPEATRAKEDLGRFGLGLKTASFAQTRSFTVISRKKGSATFTARTWDVAYLKSRGWMIIVHTTEEVNQLITKYKHLTKTFLGEFEGFEANTIVIWRGLYKFENYVSESTRKSELKKQLTEVTSEHLSMVFHRFMVRQPRPLRIRINNQVITPFNPFPADQGDFRKIDSGRKQFQDDNLKIEGFVLPARSLDESKSEISIWAPKNKSLMDMEGMYIYRADRIIVYGGWYGIIKKSPRLQLARLRVDIGNKADKHFHLNVAKSSIIIPYELRMGFLRYVNELKREAEREYYNRDVKRITVTKDNPGGQLFLRVASEKGLRMEINRDFTLLKKVMTEISPKHSAVLRIIFRMINTQINRVRQVHEDQNFNYIEAEEMISADDLAAAIRTLRDNGLSKASIRESVLPAMGLKINSIPESVLNILID
jgi:hypothetical protein